MSNSNLDIGRVEKSQFTKWFVHFAECGDDDDDDGGDAYVYSNEMEHFCVFYGKLFLFVSFNKSYCVCVSASLYCRVLNVEDEWSNNREVQCIADRH